MPIVTLTTDFGHQDTYVGVMKGVILQRHSNAQIVDVTHGIPPRDIAAGAQALLTATPFFPADAIHLAVVDPGVGTARSTLAARTNHGVFLGPDNGLLSLVLEGRTIECAVTLDRPQFHLPNVSSTFHGRDVFASIAGHLAAGAPLESLGSPRSTWERLQIAPPVVDGNTVTGRVQRIDSFGNLITDITAEIMRGWDPTHTQIAVGTTLIKGMHKTFGEVPAQQPVAYLGSDGNLELAVNQGNAAQAWNVQNGTRVVIKR